LVYFGRGSHDEALAEFERRGEDLLSGRPEKEREGLTVYSLCAKFLQTKKNRRDEGSLAPRTFHDYTRICKIIIKLFGRTRLVQSLTPDDFEKARRTMAKKGWNLVSLKSTINKIRVVFNFAYNKKQHFIDKPLLFGEGFDLPSKKAMELHRQEQGPRMFEAQEIRAMLQKAKMPLRAMIYLGINCGFGNSDVGNMPIKALDLEKGWVNYPRPKTAKMRRCALWPETVAALREWLAIRPQPKKEEDAGLVFLTGFGQSWAKDVNDNPVSKETAKLLKALKINGHRGFYCLRHSFQTIADESGDFIAVRKIMGHASNDIADVYRERMVDSRLAKVAEHVRAWLLGDEGQEEPDVVGVPASQVIRY
jgi:integrase